jgi:hypothetical protein
MSVNKFKFVSPGVFTKEIDNSQLPAADRSAGPVIIGRLPQGPAMEPIKVNSFSEFVEVFGNPVPGKATGDVWRDGNYQGPTYAAYASQAYLRNSLDAITVVRLAGEQNQDATDAGRAGWGTANKTTSYETAGGAYGLFLCNPTGTTTGAANEEGYLAAVWYFPSGGAVSLTGSLAGTTDPAGGLGGLFVTSSDVGSSNGPDYTAVIHDNDASGTELFKTTFNLDPSSRTFIRKVFNTNPQSAGEVIPASTFSNGEELYWLGETYESFIQKQLELGNLQDDAYGVILPFDDAGKSDYRFDATRASTGWFFSQDISTDFASWTADRMQKLFKLHALEPGKWVEDNLKVSIQDLTYSRDTTGANPYGTFTVMIRRASDTDNSVQTVERFSNCSLNPLADNYVAKKIGDKYRVWDASSAVLREYGEYDNASKYVRVEVDDSVRNGIADPDLLPFGVFGPDKIVDVLVQESTLTPATVLDQGLAGPGGITPGVGAGGIINTGSIGAYAVNLNFPELQLRISSSAGGLIDQTDAYFGLNAAAYLENTTAYSSNRADAGYADYVYPLGSISDANKEPQWAFSLDNISGSAGEAFVSYQPTSRVNGLSLTAVGSWRDLIDDGWTRFTAPLFGGFDGLDVTEIEPFRNAGMSGKTLQTSYALNTLRQAVDSVADPEAADYNLMAVPGIVNTNITDHMLDVCADRGDALAVVDIEDVYTPFTENSTAYSDVTSRAGSVSQAVTTLENRQINNSYGCTYYPWVQIQDTVSSNSRLWVPPSVVALGTFASSAAQTEVWFAPAGFNRGGLSQGSAGIPVLNVSQRLTSKERDTLYDANINPIASFPNEGIVIFGQKTLQLTPSALDRINVRRMMIFVKKQISIFANSILFDQNVEVTWNRFKSLANPFLASVQTRLGLSDYRLILDKTTTTPDLVDRNIVYAKIFLKPAKAIEYIALDFVITNQGASFED